MAWLSHQPLQLVGAPRTGGRAQRCGRLRLRHGSTRARGRQLCSAARGAGSAGHPNRTGSARGSAGGRAAEAAAAGAKGNTPEAAGVGDGDRVGLAAALVLGADVEDAWGRRAGRRAGRQAGKQGSAQVSRARAPPPLPLALTSRTPGREAREGMAGRPRAALGRRSRCGGARWRRARAAGWGGPAPRPSPHSDPHPPLASMEKETWILGMPRGAGGMPAASGARAELSCMPKAAGGHRLRCPVLPGAIQPFA